MKLEKKKKWSIFKPKKSLSKKVSMLEPVHRTNATSCTLSSVFGEEEKPVRECYIMPGSELSKPTREDRICCTTSGRTPSTPTREDRICCTTSGRTPSTPMREDRICCTISSRMTSEDILLDGFDTTNTIFCDMEPKVSELKKIGPKK